MANTIDARVCLSPQLNTLSDAAFALYMRARAFASFHETKGVVSTADLRRLATAPEHVTRLIEDLELAGLLSEQPFDEWTILKVRGEDVVRPKAKR